MSHRVRRRLPHQVRAAAHQVLVHLQAVRYRTAVFLHHPAQAAQVRFRQAPLPRCRAAQAAQVRHRHHRRVLFRRRRARHLRHQAAHHHQAAHPRQYPGRTGHAQATDGRTEEGLMWMYNQEVL